MSENESRPLERWSMGQVMWSGRTSEFVNAHATADEIDVLRAKAAALDKILAAWGITWGQYKQQPGTDAPITGREPNVDSEKDRVESQV